MKNIAVEDMTFSFVPSTVYGVVALTGLPSTRLRADNKSVCLDEIGITVSGITADGAPTPDPVIYSSKLNASGSRLKSEEKAVLLEGDLSDSISATPLTAPPPGGTPVPVVFKIQISDAGQERVKTS